MNQNNVARISNLNFAFGAIVIAVTLWGIYGLKISNISAFLLFKVSFLALLCGQIYLVRKEVISTELVIMVDCLAIYLYALIGSLWFDPTYLFAFYEGIALSCFFYHGSWKGYIFQMLTGVLLTLISLEYMPEPDFVKEGFSIKHHLQIMTIVFASLSLLIYGLFSRQRELLLLKDQKFASIGRQSAFLLHELKSPLNRFMLSNSEENNRDAKSILSIVESVELLVTHRENLRFEQFSWEKVKNYLHEEFDEMTRFYQLNFEMEGFDGVGWGHKSIIKLALKNLVKNAAEAIIAGQRSGSIKVIRKDNEVIVQNNGPLINKEKANQLFTPFQSDKNNLNNFGIGLHFVENVVKVHGGTIDVDTLGEWTLFKIKLGEFK